VETREAAEIAIQELNGKTFQDTHFSVSFARPRKNFNRHSSYNNPISGGGGPNYHSYNNYNNNNQNRNQQQQMTSPQTTANNNTTLAPRAMGF
jgi:hypothetical protein